MENSVRGSHGPREGQKIPLRDAAQTTTTCEQRTGYREKCPVVQTIEPQLNQTFGPQALQFPLGGSSQIPQQVVHEAMANRSTLFHPRGKNIPKWNTATGLNLNPVPWGPWKSFRKLLEEGVLELGCQEEYARLGELFETFANKETNVMELHGFKKLFRVYPIVDEDLVDHMFSFLDRDTDGRITSTEFVGGMIALSPKTGQQLPSAMGQYRLQLIFINYDSNKDGLLDRSELSALLEHVAFVATPSNSPSSERTKVNRSSQNAPDISHVEMSPQAQADLLLQCLPHGGLLGFDAFYRAVRSGAIPLTNRLLRMPQDMLALIDCANNQTQRPPASSAPSKLGTPSPDFSSTRPLPSHAWPIAHRSSLVGYTRVYHPESKSPREVYQTQQPIAPTEQNLTALNVESPLKVPQTSSQLPPANMAPGGPSISQSPYTETGTVDNTLSTLPPSAKITRSPVRHGDRPSSAPPHIFDTPESKFVEDRVVTSYSGQDSVTPMQYIMRQQLSTSPGVPPPIRTLPGGYRREWERHLGDVSLTPLGQKGALRKQIDQGSSEQVLQTVVSPSSNRMSKIGNASCASGDQDSPRFTVQPLENQPDDGTQKTLFIKTFRVRPQRLAKSPAGKNTPSPEPLVLDATTPPGSFSFNFSPLRTPPRSTDTGLTPPATVPNATKGLTPSPSMKLSPIRVVRDLVPAAGTTAFNWLPRPPPHPYPNLQNKLLSCRIIHSTVDATSGGSNKKDLVGTMASTETALPKLQGWRFGGEQTAVGSMGDPHEVLPLTTEEMLNLCDDVVRMFKAEDSVVQVRHSYAKSCV
eukprot:GHVN01001090.1.p1 GENE.GHVN01001090.1~~GHVN01001090.1.p1  ORF type:complete len:809 (-),score=56.06 GHVN01001090.1:2095-4521(-)